MTLVIGEVTEIVNTRLKISLDKSMGNIQELKLVVKLWIWRLLPADSWH